eukprot:gene7094-9679_t
MYCMTIYRAILFFYWIIQLTIGQAEQEKSDCVSNTCKSPILGTGEMFDSIAGYYDITNRFMSFGQDLSWRNTFMEHIDFSKSSINILDLATGTGDVAIVISKTFNKFHPTHQYHITGIDPSKNMLAIAHTKINQLNLSNKIDLQVGDAQQLINISNEIYDYITMSFGIRNVLNRKQALQEINRILKNDNKSYLLIMEFVNPNKGYISILIQYFLKFILPSIGTIISGGKSKEYNHLKNSILQFPNEYDFLIELSSSGFHECQSFNIFMNIVILFKCKK